MATLLPMLGGVAKRTREGSGTCLRTLEGGKRRDSILFPRLVARWQTSFFRLLSVQGSGSSSHSCDITVSSIMSEPSKPEAVPGNFLEEDDDDDDLFVSAIQV